MSVCQSINEHTSFRKNEDAGYIGKEHTGGEVNTK